MQRAPEIGGFPDPVFTFTQSLRSVETRVGPVLNQFVLSQTFPWFGTLEMKGKLAVQEAAAQHQIYLARQREVIFQVKRTFYPEILELLQNTSSDRLIEHIAHVLPILGDQSALAVLLETWRGDYDGFLKVTLARAILELKDPSGFPVLINILGSGGEPELACQEAIELLRNFRGKEFRYGPDRDLTKNGEAIQRWRLWWAEHGSHLKWREQTRRFE